MCSMETRSADNAETPSVMLISVGGSPAPIVRSIELNRPARIVFFVSRGSYASVTGEILPAVLAAVGRLPPHECVVTPDEQDVGLSVFALLREVPAAMRKLGEKAEWPELVDFTGGTKVMSAALVWAASRFPCTFSYIGSATPESRTRGGLGVVVDGREKCLLRENPWNEIAYYDVRQAVALFNGGQYANAVAALGAVLQRVSEPHRVRLLTLLCGVWRGYAAWDAFDHLAAMREFAAHAQALLDLAPSEEAIWPGLLNFAETANEHRRTLAELVKEKADALSWPKIYDLLANALRRARLERRHEDATARAYAAIEKYGKHALKRARGIDSAACRPEQLPESLHAEYVRRFGGEGRDTLQFGLEATYRVLTELGDPVGERYLACREELAKVLPLRNASILGHGIVPIKPESFERLLAVALQLMALDESALTVFPGMMEDGKGKMEEKPGT
jgi:CRISPR-associated protein (TIGR02710 family)